MAVLIAVFWFTETNGKTGVGRAEIQPPHPDIRTVAGVEEIERRLLEADQTLESVCLIDWKILES